MWAHKWGRMFWGYSVKCSYQPLFLSHMFYLTVEHAEEFISTVYCFMSRCIYTSAAAHSPQQCTNLTLFVPTQENPFHFKSNTSQIIANVLFTGIWFQHNAAEILMFQWKLKRYDILYKYQPAISIPERCVFSLIAVMWSELWWRGYGSRQDVEVSDVTYWIVLVT